MRHELILIAVALIIFITEIFVDEKRKGIVVPLSLGLMFIATIIGFLPELDNTNNTFVHPWLYEQIDKVFEGKDSMQDAIYYIEDYYGE